jgi:3-methyladenine DNA glycosylase/8-oxoguanine DNA glycosylase
MAVSPPIAAYGSLMAFLDVPQPFSFEHTTERFRVFGPDNAILWHEGGVHRVVGGREVRVEAAPGGVDVEPLDGETKPVVLKLLGAEFELDGFRPRDPLLAGLAARLTGYRPPLAPDPFEMLVGAISAQQISLRAALAVRNRFVERFGGRAKLAYAFPTAERVARAEPDGLTSLGFSRRKAEYILALARAGLDYDALALAPDEEVRETLMRLPGIGEWTADWFLARHLARPRAWPAGDLALRKVVSSLYGDGRPLTTVEVREIGNRFDPFQNLSAHYLLLGARLPG